MSLSARVQTVIQRHALFSPDEPLIVGVSGGPDSLCLLHLLRELAPALRIAPHVAHLHHGIRGAEADADAAYVERIAHAWHLPCTVEHVDVPALAEERRLSIEEAARQARYAFLAQTARRLGAGTVAVAHNADDQVETVLMHLLRGSGLSGLRGMRPSAWLDEDPPPIPSQRIRLVRPLLDVPRRDIIAYCQAHDLSPRHDRSNLDTTYYRNRLRHELIPQLEHYNPNLRRTLTRTADVLAADYDLLQALTDDAWTEVTREVAPDGVRLDLVRFRAQPLSLQRALLRRAVSHLRRSLRNIGFVHIDDALAVIATAQVGARVTLPAGLLLALGYSDITIAAADRPAPHTAPAVAAPLPIRCPGITPLPNGNWRLVTKVIRRESLPGGWRHNPDPLRAYLDRDRLAEPLVLRPRRSGDRFWPLGLGHEKSLRNYMIDCKLPRAERDQAPLLTSGDDIAWLVGYRIDARFAISDTTRHVVVAHCRLADLEPPEDVP